MFPSSLVLACAGLLAANMVFATEPPVMRPEQLTERGLIEALAPLPAAAAAAPTPTPAEAPTTPAAASEPEAAASGLPASRSRGFRPMSRPMTPAPVAATTAATSAGARKAHILMTFETNSSGLTPETVRALDLLGRAMASSELEGMQFVVEGHADPRGDAAANLLLSQKRAEAVVDYLRQTHRVPTERLIATGKGASEPLLPQRLDAPENRRVTIVSRRQ